MMIQVAYALCKVRLYFLTVGEYLNNENKIPIIFSKHM